MVTNRLLVPVGLLLSILIFASFVSAQENNKKEPSSVHGVVTEVIEAAGYTYVEINTGSEKVWAAGPDTPLKIGDKIGFSTDMAMTNFHSKAMQRDFSIIYFVDVYSFDDNAVAADHSQLHPDAGTVKAEPVVGVHRVAGGQTIADIYTDKQLFNGKIVRVQGKVIKFSPAIMGKNWVHIRDSSSEYDLTMTTNDKVETGDVIVVEGRLVLDRDFGYGYLYPIIIEDGKVI